MHIYNNHPTGLFVPYAGRTKRGVQINPGQMGPDVPLSRLVEVPHMYKDLGKGRIQLVVSAEERALLLRNPQVDPAWLLDADTLTVKETGGTTAATTQGVDVNLTADELAAATSTDAIAPAVVVPPAEPTPKFNAIAAQLISELKVMKGLPRHNKLKQLRSTTDAGILAALPQVEAFFAKDKGKGKAAAEEEPVADDPEPPADAAEVAPVADNQEPPADVYTDADRATLLSECVKLGLPIEPTTPDSELRELLRGAK